MAEALRAYTRRVKKASKKSIQSVSEKKQSEEIGANNILSVQQVQEHEKVKETNFDDILHEQHPQGSVEENEKEKSRSENLGEQSPQNKEKAMEGDGDGDEGEEYVAARLEQRGGTNQAPNKGLGGLSSTVVGVLGVSSLSGVGADSISIPGQQQPSLTPPLPGILLPTLLNEEDDGDHELSDKERLKTNKDSTIPSKGTDQQSHLGEREQQRDALLNLELHDIAAKQELDIYYESSIKAPHEGRPSLNILIPSEHEDLLNTRPIKSLTGVPIKSSRLSLFRETQESRLRSRTPHNFLISVGRSERELLKTTLEEGYSPMCQITVSNYARLFVHLNNEPLRNSFTALPIASLYRDSHMKSSLPQLERRYLNEDGTGFLVRQLVKDPNIIAKLEVESTILMFTDAAIFEAPKEQVSTEYVIPEIDTTNRAGFVVTQRLDMSELSLLNWRLHKDQIGLYIALYYEAAYMAAITQKANALLLAPVLINATTEQYSYMLDILLRVHRTLSSRMDAAEITLAMPPQSRTLNLDYESAVRLHNLELAKEDVKIYLEEDAETEIGSRIRKRLIPLEHSSDSGDHEEDEEEDETSPVASVILEAKFGDDTGFDVFLDEGVAPFLLSNYFKCPKEDKRRATLAPTSFKVGNGRILNKNVIINSIHID